MQLGVEMMMSKSGSKLGVLALVMGLALGVGAGCSLTTMETARQLENGEAVVGGGLDWPGDLQVPRMSAYGKVGVGDRADLGVQGGFAFATANLGASARFYPTTWLTMSLQTEAMLRVDNSDDSFVSESNFAAGWGVTPRISTAVKERGFYVGVQANVLSAWEYNESGSGTRFGFQGALAGGFVGLVGTITRALSFQTELIVLPLTVTEDGTSVFVGGDVLILPVQWSVGFNYRFGGESEAVGEMEASEAPEVEEPGGEQPTASPEPEQEPEYDEGGVPIY